MICKKKNVIMDKKVPKIDVNLNRRPGKEIALFRIV